jgi:hypothetical protein
MVVRGFLKFLAAFLAAALIFVLILGVAGYFAVRNFDPNMFRAEFEKYLTQQTGFRVELGDIKLRWRPQPQIQVEGLKFYHPVSLEKLLQGDQVKIDMDLTSVWQKRFSMSQVMVQSPEVFLKRDWKGLWNWQSSPNPAPPAAVPAPMVSQVSFIPVAEAAEGAESRSLKDLRSIAQGWEFGVGKIRVLDATVHFEDATAEPAFGLELKKLDLEVKQQAIAQPFHFTVGGSVLNSAKRNLEAEGDLDLAARSLDFVLRYGPEKAEFKGRLKLINTLPHFEGALEVRDLDMDSVIPEVYKRGDYVSGRLSAKANLSFEGANPDMIQRSLAGQGTLEIKDGALRNRNLIREVFERLSTVLSVTSALGGELPPELDEMLKGNDTPFDSLSVVYAVRSGVFRISEFHLVHSNYQLVGQGSYGLLDKRVDGVMQLVLSKSISAYMTKKIREMEMIADKAGQIVIPFRCGGAFPDISVQPDLGYLGSRLLQGETEQLLNAGLGKLSKKLGGKQIGLAAPSEPASQKEQLIQQGLALFSKYQASEKTRQASELSAPSAQASGQAPSADPVSDRDQLIQQGLALFSKYQEIEEK